MSSVSFPVERRSVPFFISSSTGERISRFRRRCLHGRRSRGRVSRVMFGGGELLDDLRRGSRPRGGRKSRICRRPRKLLYFRPYCSHCYHFLLQLHKLPFRFLKSRFTFSFPFATATNARRLLSLRRSLPNVPDYPAPALRPAA
jgi:hypothetical protein